VRASQAKSVYQYKNLKAKVQRCCSNIYLNRLCLKQGLIPKYAQIKIPYTSPTSIITQKETQIIRLKEDNIFYSVPDFILFITVNIGIPIS